MRARPRLACRDERDEYGNVRSNPTDHLAIRDLLDRYTDVINERDWTTLENLFTEHGVWTHSVNDDVHHVFEGRGTVVAGLSGLVESTHMVIQMNHAKAIHVDRDRATARSTIQECSLLPDGTRALLFGTYHDEVVRERDGDWRFARRHIRLKLFEATTPSGDVISLQDVLEQLR
jgi:uncharacterized protein (TIGR02246 family)